MLSLVSSLALGNSIMSRLRTGDSVMLTAIITCSLFAAISALSDSDRVAKLEDVRRGKRDGLLVLNSDSFRKYIEPPLRSYSVMVLMTADPSICKVCAHMKREFTTLAADYYKLPSRLQARHPVFFAELKLSLQNQELLTDYGIEHVPILHHFGPAKAKQFPGKISGFAQNGYEIEKKGVSVNSLKDFVNGQTGARFSVTRGSYEIPFASSVRSMMPGIVTGVALFAATSAYLGWVQQPMFWFGICVMVYLYSLGGGHYTWINNSAFAVVDANGATRYVAEGSRNQHVAEGMLVSLACTVISAVLIVAIELPHLVRSKGGQTIFGLTLAVLVSICITMLLGLYFLKVPGYLKYEA